MTLGPLPSRVMGFVVVIESCEGEIVNAGHVRRHPAPWC